MVEKSFLKACFGSVGAAFVSLLSLALASVILAKIAHWMVFGAVFSGTSSEACREASGACWVFVKENVIFFMYGMLEEKEHWRAQLFISCAIAAVSLLFFRRTKALGLWLNLLGMPLLAMGLIYNLFTPEGSVDRDAYGGLFLTLFVAYFGILWAFPLGTLLALGRRSGPMVVRLFCLLWIEIWRGVPLITVLFMSSVLVPYFLPEGVELSKLTRAMVGIVCFSGAYMAEVIRGGLQGVPFGQQEVSSALGLNWWQSMRHVVLPQAIQIVSPAILNNFISLFKDTTLVAIIGMFDFLGAVQAATKNSAWLGYAKEGYVFAALVFWVFCFGLSKLSARLNPTSETSI